MRYCVGSNVPPIRNRIRRSASRGPYGADRTQSPDRRGSASSVGSRAHARVAGCSAGRSACPWPRLFLLIASGRRQPADRNTRVDTEAVGKLCVSLVTARHPGPCWNCCSVPGRGRIADVRATVRGYGPAFAGSNLPPAGRRRHLSPGRGPDRNTHGRPANTQKPLLNVAEWLALRNKTVSFWQCRFHPRRRQTTKRGCRAASQFRHHHVVFREVAVPGTTRAPVAGTLQSGDSCPSTTVDNYVDKTVFVVSVVVGRCRPLSQGVSVA